jgi:hypothetical protein
MPLARILSIVTIKLIAPAIEEAPARCKAKIPKSTAGPECPCKLARGEYKVQPVPTPPSITLDINNKVNAGGNNQKLKLFNRGKAISGAPKSIGTNQLPKPPTSIGIVIKKIIINACAVTITLYNWLFPNKTSLVGEYNCIRIKKDNTVPITPEKAPKNI